MARAARNQALIARRSRVCVAVLLAAKRVEAQERHVKRSRF